MFSAMSAVLHKLESLPIPEQLQLVEDLWDSIALNSANVPMPQWQKDELTRRKRDYVMNPDSGKTWDQVKRNILQH